MGSKAARSLFCTCFLVVLFPVGVQLSSDLCVTYKHKEICGLKGSSVKFPCSYPTFIHNITILGWSIKFYLKPKLLKIMKGYSTRMEILGNGNNDCTMKLKNLKLRDNSTYYFMYSFSNATGDHIACDGNPGVRLHIFASPVSILVEQFVSGYNLPVENLTATEGQRILLTCVPTCTENLNTNPGYIWYKDRLQLNGSRVNILSLDPVSMEDMGSYACAMIGYKGLPSSVVNLRVERRPRNTVAPGTRSNNDTVPTLTNDSDAQCSTHHTFNNCQTPQSMQTLSIMLVACFVVGLVIVIMVALLQLIAKKKEKKKPEERRRADSVKVPSNSSSVIYMALDFHSMSPEYDTLDTVRRCSASEIVYDNLPQHQPAMR